MPDIIQTCKISGQKFTVTESDQKFYKKMSVGIPTLCPDERQRRRMTWRNELNLYKRKCDMTGKEIISNHSPDKSYKVYDHTEWYGDKWDATSYGRPFNFNRTFFEQFKELWDEVPKLNLLVLGDNVNSDFTHDAYRLKNCYLIFDGEQAFDCLYGETFAIIKSSLDFLHLISSEFCYECVNCAKCYNLKFSSYCNNCSDSVFLLDCQGCRNCFGCINLRQKQYYIFNEHYSKEEYEKQLTKFNLKSYKNLQNIQKNIQEHFTKFPKKYMHGFMNENVTGDNIDNCKDSFECFDCAGLRDCKFCTNVTMAANDCYDVDIWGDRLNRAVDCDGAGAGAENIVASFYCGLEASNIFHSAFCWKSTHDVLGSVALMKKRHCILNKQYSPEEYEFMFEKIKKHMQKTEEWGEFFPIGTAGFSYNETIAQEYFPLTREEAKERGYDWKDPDTKEYQKQTYEIPDNIDDVSNEIEKKILACITCGRNYKITPQEFKFYKRNGLPIPRKCFHCRHKDRRARRNPRHLWERNCDKCGIEIKTTYSPSRPDKIYCEKCYLEIIL